LRVAKTKRTLESAFHASACTFKQSNVKVG
jgi:hypothetical protein